MVGMILICGYYISRGIEKNRKFLDYISSKKKKISSYNLALGLTLTYPCTYTKCMEGTHAFNLYLLF